MDDLALLHAYGAENDQAAFEELVRRHLSLVYGVAFRDLKDHQLTEELCQDVFVVLGRAGRRGDSFQSIPAWLFGVTRKKIAFIMRTETRRRQREQRAAELAIAEIHEEGHSQAEYASSLQECLATLPTEDQAVLMLRYYEEHSLKDIAQRLGVKEKAAQKRVQRAVERLRGVLAKRKLTLAAGVFTTQLFNAGATEPPACVVSAVAQAALHRLSSSTVWSISALLTTVGGKLAMLVLGVSLSVPVILTLRKPLAERANTVGERAPQSLLESRHLGMRIDDIEAIYRLPHARREAAIARLTDYLSERAPQSAYLTDLFTRWSSLDPLRNASELVTVFQKNQSDEAHAQMIGELFSIPVRQAWNRDREALVAWLHKLPRTDYSEAFAFEAMLEIVAESDLPKALDRLRARPYNRARAFEILAVKIAQQPMARALRILTDLQDDEGFVYASNLGNEQTIRQKSGRSKDRLLETVLPRLFENDSQATADWILTLPPSPRTTALQAQLVSLWGRHEPERAAEWVLDLPEQEKSSAIVALVRSWTAQAPKDALTWSSSLEEESIRWTAIEAGFTVWLDHVESPPTSWLASYANEPRAKPLFAQLADHLPAEASYHWSRSLSQGANRTEALQRAFYRLGQQSVTQGQDWLGTLTGDEQFAASYTFGLGWLVSGGRKALNRWKQILDKGQPLVHGLTTAEVDLIAAIDPQLATRNAFGLPKSRLRDPVIIKLIERTMNRSEESAQQALTWTKHISQATTLSETQQRVRAAMETHNAGPRGSVLPEGIRPDFRAQPLDDLLERLDVLSSMPVSRKLRSKPSAP